jgi:ElaA protein
MTVAVERSDDLETALAIRAAVFIEEQGVSVADEVDGLDPDCLHWLAFLDGRAVGTLRVRPLGTTAKIQRVAVLRAERGHGIGARLMEIVMDDLRAMRFDRATLGAQLDALGFYERLGFAAHGPVYDDAGLPHRDMTRDL